MARQLTINSKTFNCDYAGVGYRGYLKAQILDNRKLSEIAPEVEGSPAITYTDEEGTTEFANFTRLMRLERIDDDAVVLMLEKVEEPSGNEHTEPNE